MSCAGIHRLRLAFIASCAVACQPVATVGDGSGTASAIRSQSLTPALTKVGANAVLLTRADRMVLTRIAFGSCAYQERPQPLWDDILKAQPQLFIFAGDNVYGDVSHGRVVTDSQAMASLEQAYRKAGTIDGMARLRNTVPHLVTWDDHDYGKNDAGADFEHKVHSQQMFADFWALPPDDLRRHRPGVYSAQTFGPPGKRVQVILLDTRYFRSPLKRVAIMSNRALGPFEPDADPAKTVLGETQWQWLRSQLLQPADLRLVVSSIQVLAQGHQWERWGNFPVELERLYRLIRETRAEGIVFLSGDRHIAALYRDGAGTPYPLLEITSSGITQSFASNTEPGPNRLGDVYNQINFGTIDIDWSADTIALSIHALGGAIVRQHQFSLAQLRINGS